jgi:hypothetical protein
VKGKTENELQRPLPAFFIQTWLKPTKGTKIHLLFINGWLAPAGFEIITPNSICSLAQLGQE